MTAKTRVVLADDHPIVLAGLRNLIRAESDLDLIGEASTGNEALKLIREKEPDIAVLDISMPEINGIALSRRLAVDVPSVRVMLLTLHEDRAYVQQALDVGVRGYVLKRSAAENLVQAIRAVVTAGLYVDPAIAHFVIDRQPSRIKARRILAAPDLTEREIEALKLIASGFTTKEAAHRLGIGAKSVETYKARGIEKLGLKTRADLVRYATTQGWLASG